MSDLQLTDKQKSLNDAFNSDIVKDVKQHRFNVGNEGEDPILHMLDVTPSAVSEILVNWLDREEKVVFSHGLEQRDNVVLKRLKENVYNAAQYHLEKNNEVLLPDGSTVSVDKVHIEEE